MRAESRKSTLPRAAQRASDYDEMIKSLRTVRLIAKWTAGRQALGRFSEVVPARALQEPGGFEEIEEALKHLKDSPRLKGIGKQLRERGKVIGHAQITREVAHMLEFPGVESVASSVELSAAIGRLRESNHNLDEPDSSLLRLSEELLDLTTVSPRWNVQRLRYLARGHCLLWACSALSGRSLDNDVGLRMSQSLLRQAERLASVPGLEEQQTTNQLESARIIILVLFVEAYRGIEASPMLVGLAVNFLSDFFRRAVSMPEKIGNSHWMETLGFRAAVNLTVVVGEDCLARHMGLAAPELESFLARSLDDQVEEVCRSYDRCAESSANLSGFLKRKERFRASISETHTLRHGGTL